MANRPSVQILDCTIRDGGYANGWRFEKKLVREVYRSLSKAGVDYVEIGFHSTPKYFDPKEYGLWRFSREKDIREVCANIHGAKLALMLDFGKFDLADIPDRKDSIVSLIRLASHRDELAASVKTLKKLKGKGYEVSLQAMGYTGYSEGERREFAAMLKGSGLDFAYIADTYGSMFPQDIERLLTPLLKQREVKIGFHPHNSLQMAFANSIEAIRCGADIVDSSVFGMGRGAGNLCTEIILAYLHERLPDRFNVIPVLDCIDKYFVRMQKEIGWGYQLPYLLSGLFQCHPSYSQKVVDAKEFAMEDIWRILECVKRRNPEGFSPALLKEVIQQGPVAEVRGAGTPAPDRAPVEVSYAGRHKGRNFLILANGPTLKEYKPQIARFIKKYKPVVLGANYLGGLIVPDYHAFCNKRRFVDYIDTVHPRSKLLVSEHIPPAMVREYTDRPHELLRYMDTMDHDFGVADGVITSNCRTVSVLLLGVAAVMGAERVFAAGLDGYMNIDRQGNMFFYKESDKTQDGQSLKEMHAWNKRFIRQIDDHLLAQGKEGVHILTPTGYKEFYKGIKNYV